VVPNAPFELDWIKRWSLYSPDATALIDGDSSQSYDYRKFYQLCLAGASYLKKSGIKCGDRVAILAQNELDYVILFYALQRLGAALVPINYRLTSREVSHIVNDCKPKIIFYQNQFSEVVQSSSFDADIKSDLLSNFSSFIHQNQITESFFEAKPEDTAIIIYTSGTTGFPKGAMLSHRMLFWNAVNTALRLNINQDDCAAIFLPFFHTGGWNVLTTPFLHRGACLIILKKFDADQVLSLSEKHKATLLFGVPTTMDMMARSSTFSKVNLKNMRYAIVGGEPMPIPLIETWQNRNIPIRQGYGLTEFGPNVFSLNEKDAIRKKGSIGFPNFYVDVKVLDDQNNELGPEQVGELLLRGPMCMSGYWNNPKATAETIQDSWLYTGDLVRYDSEGYFYVVGRKKDMYKSGGENVYPVELEKVLRLLPGIRDVAVIGVADDKWGEVGKAFIVLESGSQLSTADINDYCQKNLAKFKIPKYFQFVADLPKGDSGKILKRQLREL
jgi:fatty-acyl-CoA synthase